MNPLVRRTLVPVMSCALLLAAARADAGQATQMWACEVDDDATEESVEEHMKAWLKAARAMPGGERMEGYIYHPVAVNATGEHDIFFVVTVPSFEEWGRFWDAYPDSPAAAIEEDKQGDVTCPNAALWESVELETD